MALPSTRVGVDRSQVDFHGRIRNVVKVDAELSETSTNPVQNKIITNTLESKADVSELDIKADETIISNAYDNTKTYTSGELFIYDNILYKVKDGIASVVGQTPPNDTYYEAINVTNAIINRAEWKFIDKIQGNSTTSPDIAIDCNRYNEYLCIIKLTSHFWKFSINIPTHSIDQSTYNTYVTGDYYTGANVVGMMLGVDVYHDRVRISNCSTGVSIGQTAELWLYAR